MEKRIYYNCHTHVFDRHCMPKTVLGSLFKFLIQFLDWTQTNWLSRSVLHILHIIPYTRASAQRLKIFFREFSRGSQDLVIRYLIHEEYDGFARNKNFRFVMLTVDLDSQSEDLPEKKFFDQALELADYKMKKPYKNRMLPFLCIDPYNPAFQRRSIKDVAIEYLEQRQFNGIKLYPATGFYPDDPRMDELWKYCSENNIPVMSHCCCGRVYYQGDKSNREDPSKILYGHLEGEDYQCNFSDVSHYKNVLKKFPELKICFAHAGGAEFSKINAQNPVHTNKPTKMEIQLKWYQEILQLCASKEYPNIYLDISWINHDEKTMQKVSADCKANDILNKVLYGTDFFVNMDVISEKDAYHLSAKYFSMDQIASDNAARYLSSKVANVPAFGI